MFRTCSEHVPPERDPERDPNAAICRSGQLRGSLGVRLSSRNGSLVGGRTRRSSAGGSVVNTQRLATRCAHEAATARPSMPAICVPPSTPGCRQSPVRRPPALNSAEVHTMRHAVRRQQSPNHCAWGDALRAPRVRRESGGTCIVLLWLLLREPNALHTPLAVSACQTNSLRHSMRHAHSSTHRTVAT